MHIHSFSNMCKLKHESCFNIPREDFRRIINEKKMQVLEDDYDWWADRMARHEMYMQLHQTGELNYSQLAYLKVKGLQSIPQFFFLFKENEEKCRYN